MTNCLCRRSHDITFCSGDRCDKKESCHRYIKAHTFRANSYISIAEYDDHDGKCDGFWEKEFSDENKS